MTAVRKLDSNVTELRYAVEDTPAHVPPGVAATGTLTSSGVNVSNNDTVTIGSKVYTFQTVLTNVDGNVFIGATAALSLANLFNAINLGPGAGTTYAAAMNVNAAGVVATNPTATTDVITASAVGTAGNTIATTKSAVTLTWGATTLTGGANAAVWQPLEPNSYKTFGSDVKIKARQPINASRQLKKGVVVDLSAMGGWTQDLTYSNFQDISQSFFYAAMRTKSELSVATATSAGNKYQPASGGNGYYARDLLFAKGFADSNNNGLKQVTGFSDNTDVAVTTALTSNTLQSGTISRVGYVWNATELSVDVSTGPLPRLVVTGGSVKATQALTTTGALANGETVTIGGIVYTFQTVLTNVAGNVFIGASTAATLTNLMNAINVDGINGIPGTTFAAASVANPYVTAATTSTVLTVTAIAGGTLGNTIATTKTTANATWGAATLTGGSGGRSLDSLGLIPGEFVFIGGDAAIEQFAALTSGVAVNNGFMRVRSVQANFLEFDKTQNIMVADTGTGQTVKVFFGRVIKNESNPNLIIRRSVQLERQLGAPDDALPTQLQAEYLVRSLADQFKFDAKTADIIRMELDFLANTNELHNATDLPPTGLKPGTRPAVQDTDAFNSTSDVAFTKMALVVAGNPCPVPLFSFFTDIIVTLKNNIKQNKAVAVLGAFDSTIGFFQVGAQVTAYFTTITEMTAVKNNNSVTLEMHLAKFNQGITIDLPLVVLSKALADVKLNEPILMPLQSDAATAKIISPNLDYTMLWVFWDYLPNLAG